MTLNEKYYFRGRKKSNNIKLYIILAIFFAFSITFARYSTMYNITPQVAIAQWHIEINDELLTSDNKILNTPLKLYKLSGEEYETIRTGDKGYIEIVIDPTGTEVSLYYTIELSFIKNNPDLKSNMNFTEYSLNGESDTHTIENNVISALASEQKMSLINGEPMHSVVHAYKIYWEWDGEDLEVNANDSMVNAHITVNQYIDG